MNFEEIKKKAQTQWQATQKSPKPRIFIGMGTCGIAAGAEAVLAALRRSWKSII